MIEGTALHRQRVALPPGSVVRVQLQDVSRQDVPADVVAECEIVTAGEQVPIPFALDVDPSALDPRARYALPATIEAGGVLAFATATSQPPPSEGAATGVRLMVEPVATPATPLVPASAGEPAERDEPDERDDES
jgi:putative lipoprotein